MTTKSGPVAQREEQHRDLLASAFYSFALAAACYVSYLVTAHVLSHVHSASAADDKLGGLWALAATVFVFRIGYRGDIAAAVTRMAATLLSFVLCLAYLLILPFSALGLAALIGIGTMILTVIGRPGEIVTAGITTAVVMVVAALSPHDAWQEPILRLADTAIGVAVGVVAASIGREITRGHRSRWLVLHDLAPGDRYGTKRIPRPAGGRPVITQARPEEEKSRLGGVS